MKKTSILMSLGLIAMATACGGGTKSVKDVGSAINKPSAKITKADTETGLQKNSESQKNAQKAGGAVPNFSGGMVLKDRAALLGAAQLSGIAGHYQTVNLLSAIDDVSRQQDEGTPSKNPADYFCADDGEGKKLLDQLKSASNSGSGGGCSVSFELSPTC